MNLRVSPCCLLSMCHCNSVLWLLIYADIVLSYGPSVVYSHWAAFSLNYTVEVVCIFRDQFKFSVRSKSHTFAFDSLRH